MDAENLLKNFNAAELQEIAAALPDRLIADEALHRGMTAMAILGIKNIDESVHTYEVTYDGPPPKDVLLEELHLSTRPYNRLRRSGITTLEDLLYVTKNELNAVENIGKHSSDEIALKLQSMGLNLMTNAERIKKAQPLAEVLNARYNPNDPEKYKEYRKKVLIEGELSLNLIFGSIEKGREIIQELISLGINNAGELCLYMQKTNKELEDSKVEYIRARLKDIRLTPSAKKLNF